MTVWQVFWSLLWFFLFVLWAWLVISILADVFRSRDLSGWAKAAWTVFVIVLPLLGVLVYLIARGRTMQQHAEEAADARDAAVRRYVRDVAASNGPSTGPANGHGPADEIARLADLRDKGVISDGEFQRGKAKALS